MLYALIKIFARIAIHFYCRNIAVNKKELLSHNGPLLLAVNHPNSFLDAIILCTLFDRPVYSLARGDAFKSNFAARMLYKLKILPVYRVSEGAENLEENYKTFDACKKIFRKNGIVLIFSDGRCINEWHLRPLKKGTARLAISSWQEGIDLKVLPVGINYSSFKKFGKNIRLFFGEFITRKQIDVYGSHGNAIKLFNNNLSSQLKSFVFEIGSNDKPSLHAHFHVQQPLLKKILFVLPAVAGLLVHAPLYYLVDYITGKIVPEEGHYDSAMVGLGLFIYPVFILLISVVVLVCTGCWCSLLLLVLLPFTAWSYIQLKPQLD